MKHIHSGTDHTHEYKNPHDHGHHANTRSATHSHNHSHSHTHGQAHSHTHTHTQTKKVLDRLSRAIGHLTSVRGMVEDGRDCSEVLIQLAAVRSAINATCRVILKDHLDHCIVDAVQTGDETTLVELNRAIELLMK